MAKQEELTFVGKVFQATTQGAVAAVVAASLSAVTEPIVNKVLVERIPLRYVPQSTYSMVALLGDLSSLKGKPFRWMSRHIHVDAHLKTNRLLKPGLNHPVRLCLRLTPTPSSTTLESLSGKLRLGSESLFRHKR